MHYAMRVQHERIRRGESDAPQRILQLPQERPEGQREALRRLVLNGELDDEDINTLAEIRKSGHGLAEQHYTVPLAREHAPDQVAGAPISVLVYDIQARYPLKRLGSIT